MHSILRTFISRARWGVAGRAGQSLVEYALVLSFVSLLSVAFMSIFEVEIRGLLSSIISAVQALWSAL